MWGATIGHSDQKDDGSISIHAPRVGRDSSSLPNLTKVFSISIHAPRVGRDPGAVIVRVASNISIHAPRVGRDEFQTFENYQSEHFNPRAPCGARLLLLSGNDNFGVISIHAPRVGRDEAYTATIAADSDFNPRAPCGARRESVYTWKNNSNFNPRAPCGARLIDEFIMQCEDANFNPRAPCGARLLLLSGNDNFGVISIHAPRVGRDHIGHNGDITFKVFQSTRPVWGATPPLILWCSHRLISIHAPRVGRDHQDSDIIDPDIGISIHAPRVGRDVRYK